MASADFKKLPGKPEDLVEEKGLNLTKGYTIYQQPNIVFGIYVHFAGEELEGDTESIVDQWFGPFYFGQWYGDLPIN